ncbi:protein-glutamate methylesterase/protein-glutamine glutaminase [Paenibacillus thermotolerans]|uniref:protein-glutamate methylesterase/protein-glutamine glutaminase n=1 Tax=Paenibacillus thermotolerans TaxID=3027807 RepID=UPI002368B018|nr:MULTISPECIES: chemotaxis response regulator protein-glutamate methylesterase [unclassified Paenibacillus]
MPPFGVLVVDDSAFMRKLITEMIAEDSRFTVLDTARNGRDAVETAKRLRPDVITMDVEMPEMNGLEALSVIMRDNPTPVVMLSSRTHEGTAETIHALEIGALDFVEKPSGPISLDLHRVRDMLLEKLYTAASSGAAAAKRAGAALPPKPPAAKPSSKSGAPLRKLVPTTGVRSLVAIGTSTGGPKALQSVLTALPSDYPSPIVIVQHMPPGFTKSLAQRLDSICEIRVVEAEDGAELHPGTAYIAPGGMHLKVARERDKYVARLAGEPPRNGHRPSADVLFESIAPYGELERTVVLMTGMGSDGARGMKLLHDSGVTRTIAEDKSTCIVFGMPRAAIELECVNTIVPLDRIPAQLLKAAHYQEEV